MHRLAASLASAPVRQRPSHALANSSPFAAAFSNHSRALGPDTSVSFEVMDSSSTGPFLGLLDAALDGGHDIVRDARYTL